MEKELLEIRFQRLDSNKEESLGMVELALPYCHEDTDIFEFIKSKIDIKAVENQIIKVLVYKDNELQYTWLYDAEVSTYCNGEYEDELYLQDLLNKEFYVDCDFKQMVYITRADYEGLPCSMVAFNWSDTQMGQLAKAIAQDLNDCTFTNEEGFEDAFWKFMENNAVEMGMNYYEDYLGI